MRQPTGTVTMLFTDIEGSTRLLQRLGRERYAEALELHHRLLREAFSAHGGYEVNSEGDAFFVAFARAEEAVTAASAAQRALAGAVWPEGQEVRVRVGIHTGEPLVAPPKYVGIDVHRAARIMAAGHGGQVLLSEATRDLVAGLFNLSDLGAHRLKDLSAPLRLFQVRVDGGQPAFPPLKSLHQSNLPVQPTPLVGRKKERDEITAYLRAGTRLLTLTGAGGSGKTRLALHAAAELTEEAPDGVWFVPLAAVRDARLVESTLAQVIGARGDLKQHLVSKHLLLVLDNLEQVLGCAPVIAELLSAAPGVQILATSRERLGVAAEREWVVPTLPPEDASALFVERAHRLNPAVECDGDVMEIVRRLDGLPLAIELAAARVKVLTPAQICERLAGSLGLLTGGSRDAPDRHRTLRATFEWSYDLLDETERALLACLSVFAGSFDLDAAEAVTEATVDGVSSLVDKSLLRQTDEGRFFMLETIRAFAAERLREMRDDAVVWRRYAMYVAGVTEDTRLEDDASARARDIGHIRAALSWAEDAGDGALQLRLATTARGHWYVDGYAREGLEWLERAIERAGSEPAEILSVAMAAAAQLAAQLGDRRRAAELARKDLESRRERGDLGGQARALALLGAVEDDPDAATAYLVEAIKVARTAGDSGATAVATNNLAYAQLKHGEPEAAAETASASLAMFLANSADDGAGFSLVIRALASVRLGNLDTSRTDAKAAISHFLAAHHIEGTLVAIDVAAAVLFARAQPDAGDELLDAVDALRASTSLARDPVVAASLSDFRGGGSASVRRAGAPGESANDVAARALELLQG